MARPMCSCKRCGETRRTTQPRRIISTPWTFVNLQQHIATIVASFRLPAVGPQREPSCCQYQYRLSGQAYACFRR